MNSSPRALTSFCPELKRAQTAFAGKHPLQVPGLPRACALDTCQLTLLSAWHFTLADMPPACPPRRAMSCLKAEPSLAPAPQGTLLRADSRWVFTSVEKPTRYSIS